MKKRYNYVHYTPEVLNLLTENKTSRLSNIFNNISKEKDDVYKEILIKAITSYMVNFGLNKKPNEETEYMWDKFTNPYDYSGFNKRIHVFKCTDATTPFHELERGQDLEEDKLYLWPTCSPNTGGGGCMSTLVFNLDYSIAGHYSLTRFETISRIDPKDYPEEIKRIIENRES